MHIPDFPTHSASLQLDGPVGRLEVAVDFPDGDVEQVPVIAVVCHPLSTGGGSMNNKVVTMAARALRELGIPTVRFNFRSVGNSEGEFDDGLGEQDDLISIVAWVRTVHPKAALWLMGFSFGAYVSLRASLALKPDALISIAPPVGRWCFDEMHPPANWLIVQGESDEIVDPQAVFNWSDSVQAELPHTLVRIPETTHFFHRKLIDLRGAIQHVVKKWLPVASA